MFLFHWLFIHKYLSACRLFDGYDLHAGDAGGQVRVRYARPGVPMRAHEGLKSESVRVVWRAVDAVDWRPKTRCQHRSRFAGVLPPPQERMTKEHGVEYSVPFS